MHRDPSIPTIPMTHHRLRVWNEATGSIGHLFPGPMPCTRRDGSAGTAGALSP